MSTSLIVLFVLFVLTAFYTLAMRRPIPVFPIFGVLSFVIYLILGAIFHPLIGAIAIIGVLFSILVIMLDGDKTPKWMDRLFFPVVFTACVAIFFILAEAIWGRIF